MFMFVADLENNQGEPWWVSCVKEGHHYQLGQRIKLSADEGEVLPNPYYRVLGYTWDCDGTPLYQLISTDMDELIAKQGSFVDFFQKIDPNNNVSIELAVHDLLARSGRVRAVPRNPETGMFRSLSDFGRLVDETNPYICSNVWGKAIEPQSDERMTLIPPFTPVLYQGQRHIVTTYRLVGSGPDAVVYDLLPDTGKSITRHAFFGADENYPKLISGVALCKEQILAAGVSAGEGEK